ncbi:hypothetical protein Phou_018770 [Phytohabitans houttuyneae]|uniref:RelA/SpoT domain-containing protein n=1 Tax=Phytohabitans houttuyneae TaxID=1076126 RepID=A0A6V8K7H9_9ACTN|nr:hypothetical protein Phou_018770 [Phytohabitans houttuyneae]
MPQTYGEMAIFRAAEQRSLLPGHLWGAQPQPVLLAKPELTDYSVSREDAAVLDDLRGRAEHAADGVQTALAEVGAHATRALGLDPPAELAHLETRVKEADSLQRKFATESHRKPMTVQDFAAGANDVLRFTMRLPDGAAYAPAVAQVRASMEARGYTFVDGKNFWSPGNRHFGYNATFRSSTGQLFEVQFPTDLSGRAGDLTHDLYEVVRREDESPARRVHAHLEMLAINKRFGLAGAIPPGLDPPVDTSFASWITKNAQAWARYEAWLDANGRDFASIVAEFGLDRSDFPVSPDVAKRLEKIDAQAVLLRDLPVGDGPHSGGDRGPGGRRGGGPRPDLESPGGRVDVRPDPGRPSGGWQRLGDDGPGHPGGSGAGHPDGDGGQELPDEDTIWWIFQWKGDPPQNQD